MKIEKVAIVGSGIMGSGIAQTLAQAGFEITIWSRKGRLGLCRIDEALRKAVGKKILSEQQVASIQSRISWTSLLGEAVEEAELVIEAVKEDLTIKQEIFKRIDACCPKKAILGSNTSSLSIHDLSVATTRPDKVIGIHFFNPAPSMKLVEVGQARLTSQETTATVVDFLIKLGKVPLVVKDSPGFVVNRCLMPLINSAAFVLMDQVATVETIDSAMKLGANHPMGPLALADLIGIDVCLSIMQQLQARTKDSIPSICPIIEDMVSRGDLGRKTGKGFYTYKQDNTKKPGGSRVKSLSKELV